MLNAAIGGVIYNPNSGGHSAPLLIAMEYGDSTNSLDATTPKFTDPVPADMFNTTFAAVLVGFNATPVTGLYTLGMPNSFIWPSLQT